MRRLNVGTPALLPVPASPFADPVARRRELRALVGAALRLEPGVETVRCNSWLNDHPRFLALFPPSWENGEAVSPLGYSYNWWGQFVDRTGGFHRRNGRTFRETGVWPYR